MSTGSVNLLNATRTLADAWRVKSSTSIPTSWRHSAEAALLSRLLTAPISPLPSLLFLRFFGGPLFSFFRLSCAALNLLVDSSHSLFDLLRRVYCAKPRELLNLLEEITHYIAQCSIVVL